MINANKRMEEGTVPSECIKNECIDGQEYLQVYLDRRGLLY